MILVVVYNTVWVIFERLFQITETMKLFSRVTLGYLFLVFVWILDGEATAQEAVEVTIDARGTRVPVSPWIYGRNNSLSDQSSSPVTALTWQRYRDAGITMFRESGGNNSTKYNWRKKLTSHPDWYNNVYAHDWDYAARSLQDQLPEAQGMWTLP